MTVQRMNDIQEAKALLRQALAILDISYDAEAEFLRRFPDEAKLADPDIYDPIDRLEDACTSTNEAIECLEDLIALPLRPDTGSPEQSALSEAFARGENCRPDARRSPGESSSAARRRSDSRQAPTFQDRQGVQ